MYLKIALLPDDRKDSSPKYKLVFDMCFPVMSLFVLLDLKGPSFSYPALTTLDKSVKLRHICYKDSLATQL